MGHEVVLILSLAQIDYLMKYIHIGGVGVGAGSLLTVSLLAMSIPVSFVWVILATGVEA